MSVPMPYQPDEREEQVLEVLREEGRANPMLIRERTGLRKQYVNDALRQLEKAERVEKVSRGLYQYAGDDVARVDVEALRDALEDARAAHERVDGDGLGEALDRMAALLKDDDVE